jgi:hypothetical protein
MKNTSTRSRLQIIALSTSLLSAAAGAQDASTTHDDSWVPVRHLEFLPDDIEGGRLGPEGEPIIIVPRAQQPSLIEIRAGFEAEIVKTMENM